MRRVSVCATVVGLAALLVAGSVFAIDDQKAYPGSMCLPLQYDSAGDQLFARTTNGYCAQDAVDTIFCPIVRDEVGQDDDVLVIVNVLDTSGSHSLSCGLRSTTQWSTQVDYYADTTGDVGFTGGDSLYVGVETETDVPSSVVMLQCELAYGDTLVGYQVFSYDQND